jgi:hypothetical protein
MPDATTHWIQAHHQRKAHQGKKGFKKMSNDISISDAEIKARAESNARNQARIELEKEKRAQLEREEATRLQQAQAFTSNQADAKAQLATLKDGYKRRAEILASMAPLMDELASLDSSLLAKSQGICDSLLGQWRIMGKDPRTEVPTLRTSAGLPQWHDEIARAGNSPGDRLAQVFGELISRKAITFAQGNLSAPDGSVIVTIGTASLISQ